MTVELRAGSTAWTPAGRQVALVLREPPLQARASRPAAEALERSERRFRTLIERLPLGVLVLREGELAYANPALTQTLGEGDVLAGLASEDRRRLLEAIAVLEQDRDGGPLAIELRTPRAGAEARTFEGFLLSITFDGSPAVLGVLREVTEERQLASKVMQVDRMVAVGALAAGVAHEINNPLAYVMTNLGFALSALTSLTPAMEIPESVVQALTEASEGVERVRYIVRDLKTFSRAEEERVGPFDVRPVVESSISMAQNEIRHRARLERSFSQVPPVDGNEARLGQVVLNLLMNAVQAIPEGACEQHRIRVATRLGSDGRVVIEVADTGVGISAKDLPRIFDPFFTTKPVGEGTGLGLNVCLNLVTAMGGELKVESTPGSGSTFYVLLPASREKVPVKPPPARALVASRPGKLLLVDDEPLILRSMARALGSVHQVITEVHPKAALSRLLGGERFDLILCDLMMPEMTGIDLFEAVRQRSPEQAARFVFLTGGAFTPRAREFLDAVPNERLEKPFELSKLASLIERVMHAHAHDPA